MEIKQHYKYAILLGIILLSLSLRLSVFSTHRMHMDECLYSSYAVRMVTHGDLAMNGGLRVDKPPVFFYMLAASFLINGITENAARIPNVLLSLALIYFVFILSLRMLDNYLMSFMAAFFCGTSVFGTAFSATAFQDISMTLFFIMSLYCAMEKKPLLSSVLYWLSVMSKPMTLFMLPVYLAFIIIYAGGFSILRAKASQYIKGSAFVLVPVFLWSALLANPRFGMFLFFVTQQPEAMGMSTAFVPRLLEWLKLSQYLLNGHAFLAAAFILPVTALIFSAVLRKKQQLTAGLLILLTLIYCYGMFSLLKFRQFDRYLFVLLPFVSIALAYGIFSITDIFRSNAVKAGLAVLVMIFFMFPAMDMNKTGFKSGAMFDGSDGFEKAAAFLKANESPENEIRYFGGTLSWYGYFYLAESKFASALPYYSADSILENKKSRRVFIVADTKEAGESIKVISEKSREVFRAAGSTGEFVIYEF